MDSSLLNRRLLLKWAGFAWAASASSLSLAAVASNAAATKTTKTFSTLSPVEGRTLEAITARIIPTTDTPGAKEAGAVWFMDAAFAGGMAGDLDFVRSGITELNNSAAGDFSALSDDEQDKLLTAIEDGPFFGLVHFLTLAGTFTMPSYGGNQGEVGWDLLGFERSHHWSAPFGYYDQAANSSAKSAGGKS